MIKLVVFDWNGTLFNDVEAAVVGANAKMKVFGYPPITLRQYREAFEIPSPKTYEHLGVDPKTIQAKALDATKAFHIAYEKEAALVDTRTGCAEVLQYLYKQGIPRIIFSNHTESGIIFQLDRLKLAPYFGAVLANKSIMDSHSVGKKDHLISYLKTLEFKPGEILIIGDTPEEMQIGKELGLKSIGITGGFCTTERLKAAKPDVLVNSLHEIIPAIEEF